MLQQMEERFGQKPDEMLVDGGFAMVGAIDEAERDGTIVYAPPKEEHKQLDAGQDPYARKKSDTEATAGWRARMGTPEAKAIYKERASTAALINAQARHRGWYGVTVRGRPKVLVMVVSNALAHNYGRMKELRQEQARDSARRAAELTT
jgi:hypothetical protein